MLELSSNPDIWLDIAQYLVFIPKSYLNPAAFT